MSNFLEGAICLAYLAAALFFFRFWKRSRDSIFAYFGLAFLVFASQRVIITVFGKGNEEDALIYLVRLAGYLLILFGIWQKNRAKSA